MTHVPSTAIVGAGLMGRWHAHACRQAGGRVAVVVDPDELAARRLARASAAATTAPSLETLPAAIKVDVIHVCAPIGAHVSLIRLAMSRARVVIVEKPVAPTAEETRGLLEAAATHGCVIVPVHQTVFQDGVQRATRWMDGTPLRIFDYRVCSAGASADPGQADAIAADILPHPLSLIDLFVPEALATPSWRVHRAASGEIAATCVAGATTVRLIISMNARPPRHDLTMFGDRLTVTADLFHGHAWKAAGTTSRAAKIARPLTDAAAAAGAGAVNLARRASTRELAYPGLTALIARAYATLANPADRPFSDTHILAVARARDAILSRRDDS